MKNELIVKKCHVCGATVIVENDCNCKDCNIQCCQKPMDVLVPNTIEAAAEKHKPKYEKVDDKIYVRVPHVMEEEHYIEWIALVKGNHKEVIKLKPGEVAEVVFKYEPDSTIYAMCNKHDLWKKDVI